MDTAKRQALEAAGWKCGDAEDFLGTNESRAMRMSDDSRGSRIYYTLTLLARVRVAKQALETPSPRNKIDNEFLTAARGYLDALENNLEHDYYSALGEEGA